MGCTGIVKPFGLAGLDDLATPLVRVGNAKSLCLRHTAELSLPLFKVSPLCRQACSGNSVPSRAIVDFPTNHHNVITGDVSTRAVVGCHRLSGKPVFSKHQATVSLKL